MFGKKKKDKTESKNVKKQEKKNAARKNDLKSFFNDSVIESLFDEMSSSESFYFEKDGDKCIGLMILDFNDIGGLSKKDKKNEDKGQMIEAMNKSSILCYVTGDLLDDYKIGIVPSEETLSNMREFSILADAPYKLGILFDTGELVQSDIDVTYEGFVDVYENGEKISDFIDELENEYEGDTEEEAEDEILNDINDHIQDNILDSNTEEEVESTEDSEDITVNNEIEMESSDIPFEDEQDSFNEISENVSTNDTSMNVDMNEDEQEVADEEVEQELAFDEATVKSQFEKRISSNNVKVSYNYKDFDEKFKEFLNYDIEYFNYDMKDDDTYFAKFLHGLTSQANTELKKLRVDHITQLRNIYSSVMDESVQGILTDTKEDVKGSMLHSLYEKLQDDKKKMDSELDEYIKKESEKKQKDYDARLEVEVERAKNEAKSRFIARNAAQLDTDIQMIRQNRKAEIEYNYNNALKAIQDKRQSVVDMMLAKSEMVISEKVFGEYKLLMAKEKRLVELYNEKIDKFIEDNMQSQISHTEALVKKVENDNRVELLEREQAAQLERIAQEHRSQLDLLNVKMGEMKIEYDNFKGMKDDEIINLKQHEKDMIAKYDVKIQAIYDEHKKQLDKKEELAQKVMSQAIEDRDSWKSELDKQYKTYKKTVFWAVMIGIIGVITALVLGMLIGQSFNITSILSSMEDSVSSVFADSTDKAVKLAGYINV